ncbi:MAG: hypothetical protein JOZ55_07610 [Alphaproteobacteria bacterium]|nr:hypothetical protein [Alphaproteobacteria bacterium]
MQFTPAQLAGRGKPKTLMSQDSRDHLIRQIVEDERTASEAKTSKLKAQRLARDGASEKDQLANEAALLRERELVRALIGALSANPKGLRRWAVMRAIRQQREKANLAIPQKLEDAVERAFLAACENSESFRKRNCPAEDALFFWPQGRAGGVWAVRPERARAWLADQDGA